MVGVKFGTVTFDVKAHAVLFDREVEPAIMTTVSRTKGAAA